MGYTDHTGKKASRQEGSQKGSNKVGKMERDEAASCVNGVKSRTSILSQLSSSQQDTSGQGETPESVSTPNKNIDKIRLLEAINRVRLERGVSWYHIGTRVTHITHLSSILSGKRNLTLDAAMKLATWAGLDLGEYQAVQHA